MHVIGLWEVTGVTGKLHGPPPRGSEPRTFLSCPHSANQLVSLHTECVCLLGMHQPTCSSQHVVINLWCVRYVLKRISEALKRAAAAPCSHPISQSIVAQHSCQFGWIRTNSMHMWVELHVCAGGTEVQWSRENEREGEALTNEGKGMCETFDNQRAAQRNQQRLLKSNEKDKANGSLDYLRGGGADLELSAAKNCKLTVGQRYSWVLVCACLCVSNGVYEICDVLQAIGVLVHMFVPRQCCNLTVTKLPPCAASCTDTRSPSQKHITHARTIYGSHLLMTTAAKVWTVMLCVATIVMYKVIYWRLSVSLITLHCLNCGVCFSTLA